ncbi:MAG: hypothetical protein ACXAEX_01525 [Promethearchaeota archaeon]
MTNGYRIFDMKLKNLILACKASGNYKKLAVVGFISLCNLLDEICLKLGMRPRRKEKGERLLEYMRSVNDIFRKNLEIQIFKDSVIEKVQEIELLYIRSQGNLPYKYIRQLYDVYYELRKLEIPNLYRNATGNDYFERTNLHMLNFASHRPDKKKEASSKFKPMILQKIKEQERSLQYQLNDKLNPVSLEQMIFLKKVKNGLTTNRNNTFTVQDTLKDNINYDHVDNKLISYTLIGVLFLSILLGILLVIELLFFPFIMQSMSTILLILCGVVLFLILLYKNSNKGR